MHAAHTSRAKNGQNDTNGAKRDNELLIRRTRQNTDFRRSGLVLFRFVFAFVRLLKLAKRASHLRVCIVFVAQVRRRSRLAPAQPRQAAQVSATNSFVIL